MPRPKKEKGENLSKPKCENLSKPKCFKPAREVFPEAIDLVQQVASNPDHCQDLADLKVTISVIFAYGPRDKDGGVTGAPLIRQGFIQESITDIAGPKSRADGDAMVKVVFDGDAWGDLEDYEKIDWVDEALNRVEVKTDKGGEPVYDNADRVELKRRNPDFLVEGYWSVAARSVTNPSRQRGRVFCNAFPLQVREGEDGGMDERTTDGRADSTVAGEGEGTGASEG